MIRKFIARPAWLLAAVCFAALLDAPELRAADQFASAAALYQQSRWNEAAIAFESVLAEKPTPEAQASATFYLAECRMQAGEYSAARKAFRAFLELAPRHKQALHAEFRLGEAAYLQGDSAAARNELKRFVERHPGDSRLGYALPFLGQLALQQGDGTTAAIWLRRAEAEFPRGPLASETSQWLARANELQSPKLTPAAQSSPRPSDREQARALLRQGKYAAAAEAFEKLLADSSSNATSPTVAIDRYWLALAQLGAKQYDTALKTLEPLAAGETPHDLAAGIDLARATALLAMRRDAEAIEPLRGYLARLPNGPDAATCRADLTSAYARIGKWDEASAAEAEFSAKHPNDARRWSLLASLAESALAVERLDLARRWYTSLTEAQAPPERATEARAALAWLDARTAPPAEAATALAKFLEDSPQSSFAPRAALLLARARERAGQLDAALAAYQKVIDGPAKAVELPYALLGAAQLHDRLAQDREADELLVRLDRDFPEFAERDAALYAWGWVLADLDRRDESLAAWRRLYKQHRASRYWPDATFRLAEIALNDGRQAEAVALAREIVEAKPAGEALPRALLLLGQTAALERDWGKVRPPLERLVSEFPNSPQSLPAEFWLAEADYRTSNWKAAGERLERVAGRTAQGTEPWMAMIPLRRAQLLARAERWPEAREMAASIAQRFPKFRQQYEADYVIGRAAAGLGEFDAARAAYERVIASPQGAKTETAAMSQWMIGETYFHQRRWEEALKAYHRIEILYPFPAWQAVGLLQAGKCLEQKGDWREAAKVYGRLLEQFPSTPYASDARARIEVARRKGAETR